MNGVVSRSVLTRAGIAVLVAGAHAGGLAWLTKRVVFIANADEEKTVLLVELIPQPVKPLVPLPEVEARARLPQDEPALPRLIPLPDPVPHPLPDTVRRPTLPQVQLPTPKPSDRPGSEYAGEMTDPFLSVTPEARSVLLALQCGRLAGDTDDLPCETASTNQLAAAMAMKPDADAFDQEMLPVAYASIAGSNAAASLAARQGDRYADHPYRQSSLDMSPTRSAQHAIPDSAPGSQAMRDMGARAVAQPHPVWGD